MKKEREYTDTQLLFLEYYKGSANGDIKAAMKMAGYSENTRVSEVLKSLKQEIHDATLDMIALRGGKAVASLASILDNPSQAGASNALKAAAQILDRLGATKDKAETGASKPSGGIFILPPKDGSIIVKLDEPSEEE